MIKISSVREFCHKIKLKLSLTKLGFEEHAVIYLLYPLHIQVDSQRPLEPFFLVSVSGIYCVLSL